MQQCGRKDVERAGPVLFVRDIIGRKAERDRRVVRREDVARTEIDTRPAIEFERVGGIDPLRTRVHCTRCDRRARHKAQVPLQVCIGGVFGNARYLVAADELRIGQSCAADQPQAGCQIAVDRELDALVRLIPEVSEAAVGKHTLSRSLKAVPAGGVQHALGRSRR